MRAVGAVIGGYVVIFLVVFLSFTALYTILGADGAFEPGTYEVSTVWLIGSFLLGLTAAVAGGYVCASISPGMAAKVLAGLVLVLGLVQAVMTMNPVSDPRPTVRPADTANLVAMANARQPTWVMFANPIMGAAGVLIGAGIRKR
jgi:asparagine N-glycosylation enzyme membrane subunit Stt3